MSTTAPTSSSPRTHPARNPKEHFLHVLKEEHDRTARVLRAYPSDKADLKPHPKSKSARELAWMFVIEQGGMEKALTTGFDFSKPPGFPPVPESFDAILAAYEQGYDKIVGLVRNMKEEDLYGTVQFLTAPKTIGDVSRIDVLWNMVRDQIHHRGQLTVYMRLADAKVPSIYGPSADEPWR